MSLTVNQRPDPITLSGGAALRYALPETTFSYPEGTSVSLSARQANGAPLPAWLAFNPATGTFEGSPPPGMSGTLKLQVIARDSQGREAVVVIEVKLSEAPAQRQSQWQPGGDASAGEPLATARMPGREPSPEADVRTQGGDLPLEAQLADAALQPSDDLDALWQSLTILAQQSA